jgi:hypothetical protein
VVGLLLGLQILLFLAGTFVAGILAGGSALAFGTEPDGVGRILAGLGVLTALLGGLLGFVILVYLFSFSHEEAILFQASPREALARSLRLVRAAGLPTAGFFLVFMGLSAANTFVLAIAVGILRAIGTAFFRSLGLGILGNWAIWAGANFLGSSLGSLVTLFLSVTWSYRFFHDRARTTRCECGNSASSSSPAPGE